MVTNLVYRGMSDICMVCDGPLKSLTGACGKCGSVYRRGDLVEEHNGHVQKRVPIRTRMARPKEEKRINFDSLPWVSYQNAASREEAVEALYVEYDRRPGLRRKPAREAFEVLSSRTDGPGLWILTVRRK